MKNPTSENHRGLDLGPAETQAAAADRSRCGRNLHGALPLPGAVGRKKIIAMRYLPAFTFLAVVAVASLGTAARGAAPAAASPNIFYSLPAGESPAGALLQGQDGNIYGATATGGTNNSGAIFEVTLGGRMTNLFSFDGTNGSAPLAGPIQDSAGNLYGTASSGGPAGKGTIYRISPGGGITLLAAFNGTNGANPSASLVRGTNGWYYGTTFNGGSNGLGGIFRVNESGVLSNVYIFQRAPTGPIRPAGWWPARMAMCMARPVTAAPLEPGRFSA